METIEREELKKDPVLNMLLQLIKSKHKPAEHTIRNLQENKSIPDFCEIAVHFAILPHELFISYQVASWFKNEGVLVQIEKVTIYDNEAEYMTERLKGFKDLTGFVEKN